MRFVIGLGIDSGADFGALGVNDYADTGRDSPTVLYDSRHPFGSEMGRVHSHDIHSCHKEATDKLNITSTV